MAESKGQARVRLALEKGRLDELARILVRDDDAEDLVQETLAVGLQQRDAPRAWPAWLRQVLRNLARTRKRRRQVQTAARLVIVDVVEQASPESSLHRDRMLDALADALTELDEPYRSAIHRRFFEELTPLEMARQDGDPPATVRWRVHEGVRRIRASLDRRFGGRDRWCGALVVAALPLPRAAAETAPTVAASAAWPLAIVGVVATAVALLVGVLLASGSSESEQRAPLSPAAPPQTVAPMAIAPPTPPPFSIPSAASIANDPATDEKAHDAGGALRDALDTCLADVPMAKRARLGRLELYVHAWTLEDASALVERVELTSGRKLASLDDVAANDPLDAPGVVVHDDLATCVAYTLDTERLPPWRDGWTGRIAATRDHTHPYSLVVSVDAVGNLVDTPAPRPLVSVPLDDAPVPDPDDAIAVLELPRRGAPEPAPVRLVECGSYGCPFCKRSEATIAELEARDAELATAWLHFPLDQDAADLARAAVAAHRQGRFWEMHAMLFEHPKPIDREQLIAIARSLDLDADRFVEDLDDPQTERDVARQRQVCSAASAKATPTFFVDGDLVPGTRSVDELAELLEEARSGGA
jgi:RNA polymerase sigma factor (sigma-70 family)